MKKKRAGGTKVGFTTVSLPSPLFKKITERIRNTGFPSVSSYVAYVLREILSERKDSSSEPFSTADEERVKQRLKALGYL